MMKSNTIVGELHQSEVISAMRFPLITLIVLFHLYPPEEVIENMNQIMKV